MIEYIVYYKLKTKDFRCYNSVKNIFYNSERLPINISNFYMTKNKDHNDTDLKKYDPTDEDLKKYCNDLYVATEELKTSKHITFDYIKPFVKVDGTIITRNHFKNIETIFKMISKGKYEHHEPIIYKEYLWMEKCNNGALQYMKPGKYDCFGYDFKNYYASILASTDFKIPNKPGKEMKFNQLPKRLSTGYYNIKITSDDENFKKIFSFSKFNVYTSIDVKFALELQNTYKINIELCVDVEFNAYIYPLDRLETGDKVFNKWYQKILKLKQEFPKNILLKMLSSSLWGHLSKSNKKTVNEKDIEELSKKDPTAYIIDDYITSNENSFYKLLNVKKPYFYNLRLKCFITAFGRNKTAKVAMLNLDKVVKIHTDGIIYTEELKTDIENFIPEAKSTGYMHLIAINKKCIRL